jgi:hypothetical protein
VKAYLRPFYARTKGEAVRSFVEAVNDGKSDFRKHASDYTMMYLGEFDDATGCFAPIDPERIISALECLADDIVADGRSPSGNLPM